MKILVINGSPKGKRSDTLHATTAFLDGMGAQAEFIDTMTADIHPCLGCFRCWNETPGRCVQHDGMEEIFKKYIDSDLVIWSTPLYCYGLPSNCKALMDRLLPLNRASMYTDADGHTHHHAAVGHFPETLLICGCGFPETENNIEGLRFQFSRMFGGRAAMFFCVEAPLFGLPGTEAVTAPYLDLVRAAGREYAATGALSADTVAALEKPMYPPELYRQGSKK
ncbi:MAG: flavodoxin family protein [Victivallaceae bacterium]|nr:flavodoxin family protein [Victivallaceae bacterium]